MLAESSNANVEVEMNQINIFAKHSYNQITLNPTSKRIGTHVVTINLKSRKNYQPIGDPFRFEIEVIKSPKVTL